MAEEIKILSHMSLGEQERFLQLMAEGDCDIYSEVEIDGISYVVPAEVGALINSLVSQLEELKSV